MPNHASPKKTLKQDKKRNERNNKVKKTAFSFSKKSLLCKTEAEAREAFKIAQSKIMKAYSKGVLKKNNVSRKISKLNKKINLLIEKIQKSSS